MTKKSKDNGKLAAAIEDIRDALAQLARHGETIRQFRGDGGGALIEIDRPRRNWLHGEQVGQRSSQFGNRKMYSAQLCGCTVTWID